MKGMLADLTQKMSPDMSYKSIRDILHNGTPPALPYLGNNFTLYPDRDVRFWFANHFFFFLNFISFHFIKKVCF